MAPALAFDEPRGDFAWHRSRKTAGKNCRHQQRDKCVDLQRGDQNHDGDEPDEENNNRPPVDLQRNGSESWKGRVGHGHERATLLGSMTSTGNPPPCLKAKLPSAY